MKKLLKEIIHKMRTPTTAIQSGISGIKSFMPQLIEAYQEAKKSGVNVPEIQPRHLEILLKVMDHIEDDAAFMNNYLDELTELAQKEFLNYD